MTLLRSLFVLAALACPAIAQQPDQAKPAPYQRIVESDDGNIIQMQMAIREFAPADPAHPRLFVAAAIHIADRSFYDAVQARLDALDVVLYESVKPSGLGDDAALPDDDARAKRTTNRLRVVAIMLEAYRREHGAYPGTLADAVAGTHIIPRDLAASAVRDAWGRELVYSLIADPAPRKPGFDLASLGADGTPGGDGPARDIRFADQRPLTREEKADNDGIQQQLSDALGLTFQLEAMDHNKPNWRNSDMSIDQVQERLEAAGLGGGGLFGMLDGSSFMAKVLGVMLKMLGASEQMRTMVKLTLVEALSHADEILAAAPGGGAALMKVLVNDRNEVVIDDLKRLIAAEPAVRTVGIMYGAGHLPHMQRLLADMGYTPVDGADIWNTAIRIDLDAAGISAAQAKSMRDMMRRSIEMQLKRAK